MDDTPNLRLAQGKKLFGIGIVIFSHGLIWFGGSEGIFGLQPLNPFDAFSRAEIVVGTLVAAYGILVWRGATHRLLPLTYAVTMLCASVLFLCASRLSQWNYTLQRDHSILSSLLGGAVEIIFVAGIVLSAALWAESSYMRERFRERLRSRIRSSRFAG